MNTRTLPLALFGTLVGMAASAHAEAARPAAAAEHIKPVRVEVVDEDTLGRISGKFHGADMLVGLRIELLSNWRTADGSMSAAGTLQIQRNANGGFDVQVDTRSNAQAAGAAGTPLANATASGGDQISVNGVGQVVQVAGDGNRFANLTAISFTPREAAGGNFNGNTASTSSSGNMIASVSFEGGGAKLGLSAPSGVLSQSVISGANGGIMQAARVAGQDQVGSNLMQLQLQTATMPALQQQQQGVYQALAGLRQLPR
ncbi:hypothetical protein IP90_03090 [Luteimonas cucumeris]|uniref:Uncharacterized protein n=1 Tax=Luteimonas cucumeris TaxID=985012 RepID=A0A562KW15_9GAMM|nr:hypothetical protein [Luteimonas cucumeris]TWH99475.1 hypothetical protein IP90_03090 [Luteimonas cucumeris]